MMPSRCVSWQGYIYLFIPVTVWLKYYKHSCWIRLQGYLPLLIPVTVFLKCKHSGLYCNELAQCCLLWNSVWATMWSVLAEQSNAVGCGMSLFRLVFKVPKQDHVSPLLQTLPFKHALNISLFTHGNARASSFVMRASRKFSPLLLQGKWGEMLLSYPVFCHAVSLWSSLAKVKSTVFSRSWQQPNSFSSALSPAAMSGIGEGCGLGSVIKSPIVEQLMKKTQSSVRHYWSQPW